MLFFYSREEFFLFQTKKQKKAASNALFFAFETAPFLFHRNLWGIDLAVLHCSDTEKTVMANNRERQLAAFYVV